MTQIFRGILYSSSEQEHYQHKISVHTAQKTYTAWKHLLRGKCERFHNGYFITKLRIVSAQKYISLRVGPNLSHYREMERIS
jgi:hypothetical protein